MKEYLDEWGETPEEQVRRLRATALGGLASRPVQTKLPVEYGAPITRAPDQLQVGSLLPGVQPAEALPDINMSDVAANFTVERLSPPVRLARKYAQSKLAAEDTNREKDSASLSYIKYDMVKRELNLAKLKTEMDKLRAGLDQITAPIYQQGQLNQGQQIAALVTGAVGGAQGFNQAVGQGYEQADMMAGQRFKEDNAAFERQLGQQQELIQNKAGEIDLEKKAMIQLTFKELEELSKMGDDERTRKLEEFKQGEITKRGQMRVDERIGKQAADLQRQNARLIFENALKVKDPEDRRRAVEFALRQMQIDPEILQEPEFVNALSSISFQGAKTEADIAGVDARTAETKRKTAHMEKWGDRIEQDKHNKAVVAVENLRNLMRTRDRNVLLREAGQNQGAVKEIIKIIQSGVRSTESALGKVRAEIKKQNNYLLAATPEQKKQIDANLVKLQAEEDGLESRLNELKGGLYDAASLLPTGNANPNKRGEGNWVVPPGWNEVPPANPFGGDLNPFAGARAEGQTNKAASKKKQSAKKPVTKNGITVPGGFKIE